MPKLINVIEEKPDDAIDSVVIPVIKKATEKFNQTYADESDGLYPISTQIGRGSLRPWHVGMDSAVLLTRGRWVYNPVAGWADWINVTTYRHTYVVGEGIANPSVQPQVYEIAFHFGGQIYPVIQIEEINDFEVPVGWFEVPFPVSPANNLTVRNNSTGTNDEFIRLMGETVAIASYLRDETPPVE